MSTKRRTEFRKAAEARGWKLRDIAERWGITARQMSRISAEPNQKDWDALAGLPAKSR